ncbi:hypothetical protein V6N11_021314 [Hibiscus sabdariffa]|uniref:MYB-CC type transcription factor LHEQLE-containing domain-containing protein n=1 Tax=Hibiscus sabdariffa TaxID=183260 RepID=A0ABR2NM80_9ROSI
MNLVLSTDSKPRLKWTLELHQRFVEAVNQLGGADNCVDNLIIVFIGSKRISQALQMHMEVQRKLHEKIEVQRHLQLRIEAQGKYLQLVLKKAKETLVEYSSSSVGVELVKTELSQLVSMVNNGCTSSSFSELTEV